MRQALAIFDVDGTLVDSREIIQRAMVSAFEMSGLSPPDYEATRQIVGLDLKEGCRRLAPPDLSAEALSALTETYRAAFRRIHDEPGYKEPLYDGALDLLVHLRDKKWKIGMATGKSHPGVARIFSMHDIEPFFDTVWCSGDGPGKPHPFMIEQNLQATGVAAPQSVMIGDATFDMIMGRAAGVRTIGVNWGFGTHDELAGAGADEIHSDFAALRASLERFAADI
jgi:phosphoglycolate phosphatase